MREERKEERTRRRKIIFHVGYTCIYRVSYRIFFWEGEKLPIRPLNYRSKVI